MVNVNVMKTVFRVENRPVHMKFLLEGIILWFTGKASHLFPPLKVHPPKNCLLIQYECKNKWQQKPIDSDAEQPMDQNPQAIHTNFALQCDRAFS